MNRGRDKTRDVVAKSHIRPCCDMMLSFQHIDGQAVATAFQMFTLNSCLWDFSCSLTCASRGSKPTHRAYEATSFSQSRLATSYGSPSRERTPRIAMLTNDGYPSSGAALRCL